MLDSTQFTLPRRMAHRSILGIAAGLLLAASAGAATIVVPTVTITSLAHRSLVLPFQQLQISDGVDFPCGSGGGSCSSAGFSASILHGDTIQARFEAPAGQRFHVFRAAVLSQQQFSVAASWVAPSDGISTRVAPTVVYENLTGVAPTSSYTWSGVGDAGAAVAISWIGDVSADFTFTAISFSFPVNNTPPGALLAFPPVGSFASFSFTSGGSGFLGTPDATMMTLEPLAPECSNGIDDDGDGLFDYPDDPGCAGASDIDEHDPTLPCDDGVDNDGDGLVDFRPNGAAPPGDPGCHTPTSPRENPQCSDGVDNDGDGRIDWIDPDGPGPLLPDPQCTTAWRNREAASCGLGAELALLGLLLGRLGRLRRR